MANILVHIELTGERATPLSLAVLNLGRLLATERGATLYAVLPCTAPPSYGDDDIISVLSRNGADKVILLYHPDSGEAGTGPHDEAVLEACRRFPPRLVLLPDSPANQALGPTLAGELGADLSQVLAPEGEGDVDVLAHMGLDDPTPTGPDIVASAPSYDVHIVVVTAGADADHKPQDLGDEEAEVVVVHTGASATRPPE